MTANLTIETFPNEAAASYIRGKAVADPVNFGKLPAQLKTRAFAVAGIEQADVLRQIREAIAKLPEGGSWEEAKRKIASEISPFTGAGENSKRAAASKARAEFILRTHGFQAYAVARHQQQWARRDIFPYWKYATVGDARVRPGHAALDGKVLRADDPWWNTHYPPWDWGCRCIVEELDEEDAEKEGISEHYEMPTPQGRGSYTFSPADASIDVDALRARFAGAEHDFKVGIVNPAQRTTVQVDGRAPESMWELMIDGIMQKRARPCAALTQRDGKERAVALDFNTGKEIAKSTGDAGGVKLEVPAGAALCTLHTHPNGDNTPSPADLLFGFNSGSKADYIASGSKLRRWVWLKTPTPEDARRIREFDKDKKSTHPLLIRNGVLWRSLSYRMKNADTVSIGSDRPYALYHQHGTKYMPARPFFPVDKAGNILPDVLAEIKNKVSRAYSDEIGKLGRM